MGYKAKLYTAIILGVLGALLSYLYLSYKENELLSRAQSVKVLVAKRYIPAFTRLDPSMLEFKSIPADYLEPGVVMKPEDIVGQVALAPVMASEQILATKFTRTALSLASIVPEGKRAVTIGVDAVKGVAGLISPGDFVDIVATMEVTEGNAVKLMSTVLLQNIRVLAVGKTFKEKSAEEETAAADGDASAVTLALSPQEAELVSFTEEKGKIKLVLRGSGDNEDVKIPVVQSSAIVNKMEAPKGEGRAMELYRGGERTNIRLRKDSLK